MIVNGVHRGTHPLPRGPRWIPLIPYPGFLNVAFLPKPPVPGSIAHVPTLRAQSEDSHASFPPNGQRSTAGACEEPIRGMSSPTSTPIITRKGQLTAFHGHRCCCRSLMPDLAANQPAMLARLPLQDGLDWLAPRYGSAKNTRGHAPWQAWHHRLLLVEGRPALSVPVRPPTCRAAMPITTEKREAHTAGLGCRGLSSERKGFFSCCSCFRPSPPRADACTSCSPILRRATSPHLVPVAPPERSICSKRSSLPAITLVTDPSHAYAGAVNLLSQAWCCLVLPYITSCRRPPQTDRGPTLFLVCDLSLII